MTDTQEQCAIPTNSDEEYTSSESSESSCSGSSSGEEEEEEPLLKYNRFGVNMGIGKDVSGDNRMISCMTVHHRFFAYGMLDGTIFLSDLDGNKLPGKEYSIHVHSINQICVDVGGEFMASCDDGGKVAIVGIYSSRNNTETTFDQPVKAVAIHPNFSGTSNRTFVCGGKEVIMIEERRWPLGSKRNVLHAGEGVIADIKWRGNYIVWATEKAVHVFDTTIKKRISCVSKEDSSLIAKLVPCRLFWKDDTTLIIGWEYYVKVCAIKDKIVVKESHAIDPLQHMPTKFMEVVSKSKLDCLVSGVASFNDNLVVLGYMLEESDRSTGVPSRNALAPQLLIIKPNGYDGEPTELARDMLPMKGYQIYNSSDYHLVCDIADGAYYVVSPMDLILAKKRTIDDRIEWLISMEKFEDALEQANRNVHYLVKTSVLEVGMQYIDNLMDKEMYDKAARQCFDVFGKENKEHWEDAIINFIDHKQLKAIRPYIPQDSPRLSQHTYEVILNEFLRTDTKLLLDTLKEWKHDAGLYDLPVIVNAVEERLKKFPNNNEMLQVSGYLYSLQGEFDRALKVYLQLKHSDVFNLIEKHNLWHALLTNLMNLFELDVERTVQMLVRKRSTLLPAKVVKELETQARPDYLHKYLDALFQEDNKCGSEYHEMQVELYAKFERDKLLPFLRLCNDIPLQKALDVCHQYQLIEEMIFLLGRMGNIKEALKLITERLQNVDKAIQFAMEQDDEELWDDLIKYSRAKPKFITGLLNNVGTHIDPTKLIEQIPSKVEIPHLRDSVVKLLQDFSLQIALRVGCKKILVKDSNFLMEKLSRQQRKAICITDDCRCQECGLLIIDPDEMNEVYVFFCGHVYHSHCLPARTMPTLQPRCQICFIPVNSKTRKR